MNEPGKKRQIIKGRSVTKGTALGIIYTYRNSISRDVEVRPVTESEIENELARIKDAIENVYKDLETLDNALNRKEDKQSSDIINVHKLILKDQALLEKLEKELKAKRINSEGVIKSLFHNMEEEFNSFSDPRFRSKARDIADIGNKLLKKLMNINNTHHLENLPQNSILFSERILPSDIIHINQQSLEGIITKEGSEFSHAGILAKSFDIPFITSLEMDYRKLENGTPVLLDGDKGRIILHPDSDDRQRLQNSRQQNPAGKMAIRFAAARHFSLNNEKIILKANIETTRDIATAEKYNAAAIGLTRLEYQYLLHSRKPTWQELYRQLDELFAPLKEIPITVRLLDLSGDKQLPYLDSGIADHAMMGKMGIRFLLSQPDLLEDQLKACLALGKKYDISLLIPMVTLTREIEEVKKEIRRLQTTQPETFGHNLRLGAMLEVPATIFKLDSILPHVDFISLGSNDLIQYVMAADRENPEVADYFKQGNALIIDILASMISKLKNTGIECTLCGELAGNTDYTGELLSAGLRSFSVPPSLLPRLRKKIFEFLEHRKQDEDKSSFFPEKNIFP